MFRTFCFCCALVSASVAFGQDVYLKKTKVMGGTIVETFVPDGGGQQPASAPDPNLNPAYQQPVYQGQQTVASRQQTNQHAGNCGCPICKRTLLQKTKQVRSKTITEVVTTEVFQDDHPVQFFNESPQLALQPRNSGGLPP